MLQVFCLVFVLFVCNLPAMQYNFSEKNIARGILMYKFMTDAKKFHTLESVSNFIKESAPLYNTAYDGYFESAANHILRQFSHICIVSDSEKAIVERDIMTYTTIALKFCRIDCLSGLLSAADEVQSTIMGAIKLMVQPSIRSYAEFTDDAIRSAIAAEHVRRIIGTDAEIISYSNIPEDDRGIHYYPPLKQLKFSAENIHLLKNSLLESQDNEVRKVLLDVFNEFGKQEYLDTVPSRLK